MTAQPERPLEQGAVAAQLLLGGDVGGQDGLHDTAKVGGVALDQRLDQVFLGREVVVNARLADADRVADVLVADGVRAQPLDQFLGRIEDPGTGVRVVHVTNLPVGRLTIKGGIEKKPTGHKQQVSLDCVDVTSPAGKMPGQPAIPLDRSANPPAPSPAPAPGQAGAATPGSANASFRPAPPPAPAAAARFAFRSQYSIVRSASFS